MGRGWEVGGYTCLKPNVKKSRFYPKRFRSFSKKFEIRVKYPTTVFSVQVSNVRFILRVNVTITILRKFQLLKNVRRFYV